MAGGFAKFIFLTLPLTFDATTIGIDRDGGGEGEGAKSFDLFAWNDAVITFLDELKVWKRVGGDETDGGA